MLTSTLLVPIGLTSASGLATMPLDHVTGPRLVGSSGQPLDLLGVNRSGTEYACAQGWGIFDGPTGPTAVAAMKTWDIDAVRVPLNEDCWLGINVPPAFSGVTYRSAIHHYVTELNSAGMDVILDLHWSAPGTQKALGQQLMPDEDHSVAFWSSVAHGFRADPGVLFELYNEPHNVTWKCWRDGCTVPAGWRAAGMQQLVSTVRAAGARQPIIVDGLEWANDLTGWLTHPLVDPAHQLIAGFHVYSWSSCANTQCWNTQVAPVAAQYPVIATEVGESDCHGGFVTTFLNWAATNHISALAWTWDNNEGCQSLIANYSGTPTVYGAVVRNRFKIMATDGGTAATQP